MQMCTVDDITGEEPCLRLAQWEWKPDGEHPVFLCNFHAEPFEPLPRPAASGTKRPTED